MTISILKLLLQCYNISLLLLDYSRENKRLSIFFLNVFLYELKNEK